MSTYKRGIKAHPNFVDNYFDLAVSYAEQVPLIRQNMFEYPLFHLADTIERSHEFFLKAACLGDSEARTILRREGISVNTKEDCVSELIKIGQKQFNRKNIAKAKLIFEFICFVDSTKSNLFDKAIDTLTEEEKKEQYHKYLNKVNLLAGNRGHAKTEFDAIELAIQILPNNMFAYEILGDCYIDNKNKIKALEAYKKALELAPDELSGEALRKNIRNYE